MIIKFLSDIDKGTYVYYSIEINNAYALGNTRLIAFKTLDHAIEWLTEQNLKSVPNRENYYIDRESGYEAILHKERIIFND